MTRLRRLSKLTSAELLFRGQELTARGAEATRFWCRRERWSRNRLKSILLPASPDTARAGGALRCRDWPEAHAALRSHFMRRARRFPIDPSSAVTVPGLIRARFPGASRDAKHRADRLLAGRYDLLGYSDVDFKGTTAVPDWHADPVHRRRAPMRFWGRMPYLDPAVGDHKIVWELNRHQHWLELGRAAWLSGDSRYAVAFAAELEDWLQANPPLGGINWASMLELGLRSISWIWALHFFSPFAAPANTPWLVDLLVGLDRQLNHVARHLSRYFSPNTHLLGEGLSLYVAGRVLPELKSAARWEQIGRGILLDEAHAQVNPDGSHAELSTHYHRYALDFYLLALAIARQTGDSAAARLEEVCSRLASYCRAMAGDDGRLPAIGDDDGGMLFPICRRSPSDASGSLGLAAVLLGRPELGVGPPPEEVFWMLGGSPPAAAGAAGGDIPTSQLFPDAGYIILRSSGHHAIVDAGRHGFLNGGHAHADALALILSVSGQPLLIDPGTATYTVDPPLRDRFRSTAMHNTVVLDGRPQSVPGSPFQWATRADAHVELWRPGRRGTSRVVNAASTRRDGLPFDYVEAGHDGYLPAIHRRALISPVDGDPDALWLVADHILGGGRHHAAVHWHVDPAWSLDEATERTAYLANATGLRAAIAATGPARDEFIGDADGVGWCAPVYGQLVPSLTLRFSESADAPFSVLTAIATGTAAAPLSIEAVSLRIEEEAVGDGWHRAACVVRSGPALNLALFATPGGRDGAAHGSRSMQRIQTSSGELSTDARVALLRLTAEYEPAALSLIDTRVAIWSGPDAFEVRQPAAGDLHLDRTALLRLSRNSGAQTIGQGG